MIKLSALFLFAYCIITGSCIFINEVIKKEKNNGVKYSDVTWHTHDVPDNEYPFIVSLAFIEDLVVTRHCSGSLIHPTWVLSSSHCFHDLLDRQFYVWYGNFTVSPIMSKLFSTVLKIYIHPDFPNTKFTERGFFFGDNDISLLKCGKVVVTAYGRLSTIDHSKMYGLSVKYVGSAAKNSYFELASKYIGGVRRNDVGLKKKKKGILAKNDLRGELFRPLQIGEGVVINCGMELTMWSKYVLCIAPKCSDKIHQPLHGDNGGPFIYHGKIVGVMSLSFTIPKTFLVSNGLTPVSPYVDWITHVTRPVKNKQNLTLQEKLEVCEKKVAQCNITN